MRNELSTELNQFLKNYEIQTNTHNFDNIVPLIMVDATYWFSDGVFTGIEDIRNAFISTWGKVKDEKYSISDISWIASSDNLAVCTYLFHWEGIVDTKIKRGEGRGTNVLIKENGTWKIKHEHLSI